MTSPRGEGIGKFRTKLFLCAAESLIRLKIQEPLSIHPSASPFIRCMHKLRMAVDKTKKSYQHYSPIQAEVEAFPFLSPSRLASRILNYRPFPLLSSRETSTSLFRHKGAAASSPLENGRLKNTEITIYFLFPFYLRRVSGRTETSRAGNIRHSEKRRGETVLDWIAFQRKEKEEGGRIPERAEIGRRGGGESEGRGWRLEGLESGYIINLSVFRVSGV